MIMRNQLLFMASALILLTACNSNDDVATDGEQQRQIPILLQAGMNGQTRASGDLQDNQFAKGSVINVYIKEKLTGGQVATTKYNPMTYTTTNASGALSPQNNAYPYFPTNGRGVTILGLYPQTVNNATTTFSVQNDQKELANYRLSDLMAASLTINEPTTAVQTLTFQHLLCKITIQVVAGTGSPDIEGSTVTLYNVYRDIYFSGESGTLGAVHGTPATVAVTDDCSTPQSCIIPPQDIDPCRFFRIRLAKGDVIYYYNTQTLNFESGNEYKFVITVNQNNLEVSYTVSTWKDEDDGSNVVNTHANLPTE